MTKPKRKAVYATKKTDKKKYLQYTLVVVIVVLVCGGIIGGISLIYQAPLATATTSTVVISSDVDREDVSNQVPVNIWRPKDDAVFSDTRDNFELTKYEKEISGKDAEDVILDVTQWDQIFFELDPDNVTVFDRHFYYYRYPVNKIYRLDAYHQASDLNFGIQNSTMGDITVSGYQTNGIHVTEMDIPHNTTTNTHVGNEWSIDTDDFNAMSESEQEDVFDEANWRGIYPTYNPSLDDEKAYLSNLEKITNAPALKFVFNTTINTTDSSATQVNMTLVDTTLPIQIVFSGDCIYHIFYDVITFDLGVYSYKFGMEFGDDIALSNVYSGNLPVPREEDNLGTFVPLSVMGS